MFIYFSSIIFLFGTAIGSFLNVVIDRVVRGESVVKGRSHCDNCKHLLMKRDLVPVLSYLLLGRRCRYCKSIIPFRIFCVELITGLVYASLYINLSFSALDYQSFFFAIAFRFILAGMLISVFFTDLEHKLIPLIYIIILGVNYFLYTIVASIFGLSMPNLFDLKLNLMSGIYGMIFMLSVSLLLYFLTKKRAFGEGDVLLFAVLGLYTGFLLSIPMWFFSFLTGSIAGVILILINKKSLKAKVAFGPFIILGFLIATIFGNYLVEYYLKFL